MHSFPRCHKLILFLGVIPSVVAFQSSLDGRTRQQFSFWFLFWPGSNQQIRTVCVPGFRIFDTLMPFARVVLCSRSLSLYVATPIQQHCMRGTQLGVLLVMFPPYQIACSRT